MLRPLLACLLCCLALFAHAEPELLPPDQAFRVQLIQTGDRTLEAQFSVAPGYYLYRDRISFALQPAQPLQAKLPDGEIKDDPSFGKVAVYHRDVAAELVATSPIPPGARVTITFQGCADVGICYPPQTASLAPGERSGKAGGVASLFGNRSAGTGPATMDDESGFFHGGALLTLALFYAAGVGLALTACMYPLLPIVSSIVVGNNAGRMRGLLLTMLYVQGMALTYTLAGVAAAATGTLLTVALQQPWVIAATALLFASMAFAMFGAFQFQLPSSVQSVFNKLAHRMPGGKLLPVFLMGAVSALIVGPCVAPPLVAALAYLGQTGDTVLGGAALYALALGIGTPLIVVGAFGATVLPRLSRTVMRGVKIVFGIVLLGTAVWLLRPLWLHTLPAPDIPAFQTVRNEAELDAALAAARGKPVMLDMYADWCTSCVEFERETLSDATVRRQLAGYTLLRADLTANTAADAALLRRYGLYGPPALLFFDRDGKLLPRRVIGFQNAATFSATLNAIQP